MLILLVFIHTKTVARLQSNCWCLFAQSCQIDFVLDLHGHTTSNGSFIYGNTYDNVFRYERHLVFPKLLSANAPDFASEHMMFNADERKNGSLRRFCCETLTDTVNAYTLEISMGGYKLKGTQTVVQYVEEDCMCDRFTIEKCFKFLV